MPNRLIPDSSAEVKITKALPNAANTANTNVVDLGNNSPYPITEHFNVKLSITAATGANNKNINIALQDSNESNANFTNIAELATWRNQNDDSTYAAANRTVTLPPATKRYVRATAVGETNGGDASDGTLTVQLLF